jgi:DNA polymerase III subunit delta
MPQKPEDIYQLVKNNQYSPLYFLHGDEPYYIDIIADYIENNALTPAEKGFNLTVVYGKEATLRTIVESARRFPMMAKRQVIVVKEAQELPDLGKKEAQEVLANYAKNPVPTTVLVFAYKHKKLDGRSELNKALDKHAILVESKKMYDDKIPGWIKGFCKEEGYPITEKATLMLSEYIGNNLTRIANEIRKVLLNYKERVEITEEMVMKHVGISKEFNVFELQTALANKDVVKANQIIHYFAANPRDNPVIPIIALLFGYFSKVLLVHHNSKMRKEELAALLKVNPYFVQEYQIAARNYPIAKTIRIIGYLHLADLQSKGVDSTLNDSQILKELIYKILH